MKCSQYEVVLHQPCRIVPQKNQKDGRWFLQMQWKELMKALTWETDAKRLWLGKSCSVNTRGTMPTLGYVEKLKEISLRCLPPYEYDIRKG